MADFSLSYSAADPSEESFLHAPASYSVSVDPLVFFSVLDHYQRRPESQHKEDQHRVIGALLGVRSEDGSEVEIRTSFPLAYTETEDQQVVVDPDYLQTMYTLHQRVNTKEAIVGWYATGTVDSINPNSVFLHEYFANETAPHQPVHLLVDSKLNNAKLGIKAYVSAPVGVPITEHPGSMFIQVPCDVKFFDAERSGLEVISAAKDNSSHTAGLLSDMDNLERSIVRVQDMIDSVLVYVKDVNSGKIKGNNTIGRYLMDTISSIPRIEPDDFEKMFNSHLQDLLMVVYLANLTRTQLAIAERLQKMT